MRVSGGKFNRDRALRELGVESDAGDAEILRAYRSICAPLKRALVGAATVAAKDAARAKLRRLILARDAALGRPSRLHEDDVRVDWNRVITQLAAVDPGTADRRDLLRVLALGATASAAEIDESFRLRYRALTRAFGSARTDASMTTLRRARATMRRIRGRIEESRPEVAEVRPPAELQPGPDLEVLTGSEDLVAAEVGSGGPEAELEVTLTDELALDAVALRQGPPDVPHEPETPTATKDIDLSMSDIGIVSDRVGADPGSLRAIAANGATRRQITIAYREQANTLRREVPDQQTDAGRRLSFDRIRALRHNRDGVLREADDRFKLDASDIARRLGL